MNRKVSVNHPLVSGQPGLVGRAAVRISAEGKCRYDPDPVGSIKILNTTAL